MKTRIAALDGVRGLAILIVLIHHAIGFVDTPAATGLERLLELVADDAWFGVDLFFVLSGYLITGILLRTKGSRGYFRNFIMRRVLRIFPLYYLFLVVMFVVLPRLLPNDPELAKLPELQAWYWTYLPNVKIFLQGHWDAHYVEHAWSLSIEEQFYVMWPLVVALCSRRALVTVCAAGALVSLGLRVLLVSQGAERAAALVLMPAHLDGLLLGALLATFEPALAAHPARARRALAALGVVGLASLAVLKVAPLSYGMKHLAFAVSSWSVLFVAFLGLAILSRERSWLLRGLNTRLLTVLGTYSYGLYLIHQPVMRVIAAHLGPLPGPALWKWCAAGLIGGTVSLLLAIVVYHQFEVRFLALKRFFEPRPARALDPPGALEIAPLDAATPRAHAPPLYR